ncbi:flagellar export protein FliJ [Pseudomonas sp. PLMAX]|jgi:flagellar FliJ protein|uniref:flagellar export protein FliJ n=1 Tax=Pseudomonas sp. PLMAX TaxID=2201998 RepID=UPI0038BA4EFE
MSDTSALDTLVELTKEVLDNAALRLAKSRRSEQQAREYLSTLQNYRQEYARELQKLMRKGIDSMTRGNYRSFLNSLDQAIEQANRSVNEQVTNVDLNQTHWKDQYIKLNSFETLIGRRQQTAKLAASRVEQRQADEMSAQMLLRQRHNYDSPSPGF